ncbi:MAG TPA: S41 family peptidase [Gemmatimonadaceae bacterium]|nr:S41 family peptidase [Gemmatimonadaceae bacterium]
MLDINPGLRSRTVTVGALLLISLVTGGWLLERGTRGGPVATTAQAARLFDTVFSHVARNYVDSIGADSIYRKAVDGMLYELEDPYTSLLAPEKLGRLNETTSGNYAGVGVQVDVRDGWIVVIAPTPASPAERAGIQPGDRIAEVNGRTTQGWTLEEATRAFRGQPGTSVAMRIERPGLVGSMPLTLTRKPLHQSAVRRVAMLPNGVGYIDLKAFSDSSDRELARSIRALLARGARLLILDLRSNPGGLLEQGTRVADLFLDKGQRIVSLRGRTPESNRDFTDSTAQRWPKLPLTILVDDKSASAAEIVAGALQDHDRAVIVGESTYGKGSAQSIIPLGPAGGLKITTARWFTPSGRSISKRLDRDDSDSDAPRAATRRYRTTGGRIVYDGGGITPDVLESDSAYASQVRELQGVLGRKVGQFRDALTDYALSLKATRGVASPQFTVSQEMLDEVWTRMTARGVVIDRGIYDDSAPVVRQLLTYDIARYVFGPESEFKRRVATDRSIAAALDLATGASTQKGLLERAAARQKQQLQQQRVSGGE